MISKLNTEDFINIKDITPYMLTEVNNVATKILDNKKSQSNYFHDIPKKLIQINYSKKYSKYNEPNNIYNIDQFKDKLFWCFYKILNNLEDRDLQEINGFEVEKKFKFNTVEKLKENRVLLKNQKIKRFSVEDDLVNNNKITLKTFECLCLIYKINVILLKDNKLYTIFSYNSISEDDIKNIVIDNYNLVELSNQNNYNNFDINIIDNISQTDLLEKLSLLYFVKDLDKPIKSITNYKLNDLSNIACKLNIDTKKIVKPTKQILYNLILKNL
jgi:hypothetical protein